MPKLPDYQEGMKVVFSYQDFLGKETAREEFSIQSVWDLFHTLQYWRMEEENLAFCPVIVKLLVFLEGGIALDPVDV